MASSPPSDRPAGGPGAPRRCAHANCGCAPTPAEDPYCSAYCANAARDAPPEGACACGHDACTRSQHVPHEEGEVQTAVGPDPETEGPG